MLQLRPLVGELFGLVTLLAGDTAQKRYPVDSRDETFQQNLKRK